MSNPVAFLSLEYFSAAAARSSGYLARSLAVAALPPAPGYRLAPCPHVPPPPRFRLEVRFGKRWDRCGSGPCRLDLAGFARSAFPGRRFRVRPAE